MSKVINAFSRSSEIGIWTLGLLSELSTVDDEAGHAVGDRTE